MSVLLELYFYKTAKSFRLLTVPTRELIGGRVKSCDIYLADYFDEDISTISSRHFKLYYRADRGFFVVDIHSLNGTWVNGELLRPDEERYLRHGDEIDLAHEGKFRVLVQIPQAKPTQKKHENMPLPLVEPLTKREREILRYLGTQLTKDELAKELGVSLNTVKSHIQAIYDKLGVRRKTEAIEKAKALGLL